MPSNDYPGDDVLLPPSGGQVTASGVGTDAPTIRVDSEKGSMQQDDDSGAAQTAPTSERSRARKDDLRKKKRAVEHHRSSSSNYATRNNETQQHSSASVTSETTKSLATYATVPVTISDISSKAVDDDGDLVVVQNKNGGEIESQPEVPSPLVINGNQQIDSRYSKESSSEPEDSSSEDGDDSGGTSSDDSVSQVEALAETDRLREDIRSKHSASRGPSLVLFPVMDEQVKTSVAKRISTAAAIDAPGAFNCDSEGLPLPKPSQGQMIHIGRLRNEQKRRRRPSEDSSTHSQANDDDDEEGGVLEGYVLEDMQARMHTFRNATNTEAAIEGKKIDEGKQKRFRIRMLIVIFAILLITGVVVGVVLGLSGGGSSEESPAVVDLSTPDDDVITISAADRAICDSSIDSNKMTDRYLEIREVILLEVPVTEEAIDTAGSTARLALCWLANFDGFDVSVSAGNEFDIIQRFVLCLLYYHIVGADSPEGNSLANAGWLSNSHVCDWKFVECFEPGVVDMLILINVGLPGPIPTELSLLTKLEHLEISGTETDFNGTLPSQLWSMSQLKSLAIGDNALTVERFDKPDQLTGFQTAAKFLNR